MRKALLIFGFVLIMLASYVLAGVCYCDQDNDGYRSVTSYTSFVLDSCYSSTQCGNWMSRFSCNSCSSIQGNDCNDEGFMNRGAGTHPGATETCNNVDDNCNSTVDEGLVNCQCTGKTQPYTPPAEDCSNNNDGIDNNCNTQIDEAVTGPCYTGPAGTLDVGICRNGTRTCTRGVWGSTCTGSITPQTEICDGIDNDCDTQIDEGCDQDNDLYVNPNMGCSGTPKCTFWGILTPCTGGCTSKDCDDNNLNRNPGKAEVCDGIDNDCDTQIDEGLTLDADNDGHTSTSSCFGTKDDCDDNNKFIYGGRKEFCNNLDDNCNAQTDEYLIGCGCTRPNTNPFTPTAENATRDKIDQNCDDCIDGICHENSTTTGRCIDCRQGKPLIRFTTSVPSSDIGLLDFVWYDITTKLRIS